MLFIALTCYVLYNYVEPNFFLYLQEVLVWLTKLQKELGPDVTENQMKEFVWKTLKSGQVIK